MADRPVQVLDGKTPLEASQKPTIDGLARRGMVGTVKTVPDGFAPGSDTANMSIFGCAPEKYFAGRAPLEAAAQGVSLDAGDAAFRCNMIAVSDNAPFAQRKLLSHSAGSIEGAQSKELVEYLFSHPEFAPLAERAGISILPSYSYRHLMVQKKVDIQGMMMQPPHDHIGELVGDNLPTGCANAAVLCTLLTKANELLDHHPINEQRRAEGKLPANAIWFWAEGTAARLPNFYEQYKKTGVVISAVALLHGIAKLVGLDVTLVEGATAELDTNYAGKVAATIQGLKEKDFAAIHIEAPDECSHNLNVAEKLEAIYRLDHLVTEPLVAALDAMGEPYRILIVSDHKTIVETGLHDREPVPFVLYDSREEVQSGLDYTEANGEKGEFLPHGTMLMERLFEK